jgi:hypothetical protein
VPSPGGATGAATTDTQPPTDPTSFLAEFKDQAVILSWTASTDNSLGLKYQLERSLDQANWQVLSSEITDTTYADKTAAFNVHHFYRLKAIDVAGNSSGYVTVDLTTPDFAANITGSDSTVTSDDELVTAVIPQAAIDGEASCGIFKDSENRASLTGSKPVLVGPYRLRCQLKSGDEIASFKVPVNLKIKLPADVRRDYTRFEVQHYDAGSEKWVKDKSTYKNNELAFSLNQPGQFAGLGEKRKGIAGIVATVLLLLGAGAGAFVYLLRRAQKQRYDEYIRRKYYNL